MSARTTRVLVFDDAEQVARAAADRFVEIADESARSAGRFSVALSGGSTPRRVYELLASDDYRTQVNWPSVHVFFGDERTVAPDHPDSNFRMANEALLSHVPLPPENVHRMEGVGDAAANASRY
jgi:6-phosphogluconolactonase